MKKVLLLIALTLTVFIMSASLVQAQNKDKALDNAKNGWLEAIGVPGGLLIPRSCIDSCPGPSCATNTPCGLNEAFQVVVNISRVIVAFTGSAALLMFTFGGVMFVIAAGNQDRVQRGKNIMVAAAIGIVIILGAWVMVNFVLIALTGGDFSKPAQLFRGYSGAESDFSDRPEGSSSGASFDSSGVFVPGESCSGPTAPPGVGLCDSLCGGGGGSEGPVMSDGQVCCICN